MRWTQTLIPTLKETPAEAEIPSHQLMLRAGLVRQLVAGAYTYLPLGWRALRKAEAIAREEMDRAGAVEILMPALQPVELWQESGRYEDYGDDLMKLRDRRGRHLALGPTHEEVVTDLVRRHVDSYRQLPLILYQIQTKFRDEPRPRFGVLRTCEFIMKDAYSFNTGLEQLNTSYQAMYDAYCRIFDRCGLRYVVVEAESGPIGGDVSHEFIVVAENGEDRLVECDGCRYAANLEKAEIGPLKTAPGKAAKGELKKVATPGATTIEQVSSLLGCRAEDMVKTLIYEADGEPVAVLVRGDHEVNESKLRAWLKASQVELASPEVIRRATGAPVGFAGPVGLGCRMIADRAVAEMADAVTGANEADAHYTGVNPQRDFSLPELADLRCAADGDPCPRCGNPLSLKRGIEVGHVFKLGTKYSVALGATYLDDQEKRHPVVMGCYGIGINRIVAGLIETSHDANGIHWPVNLAPYEVVIVALNVKKPEVLAAAEKLYDELRASETAVDVLLDDREVSPGVKFKDADLIGFPLRVVVGERGLKDGKVEVKWRRESEGVQIPLDSACLYIRSALSIEFMRQTKERIRGARHWNTPGSAAV